MSIGVISTEAALQKESDIPERLDAITARLDQLVKDILPSSPYILRLQGSHNRRFPPNFHLFPGIQGTIFPPEEQELQYMTFRPPSEGMLLAHGQWDDGEGGMAPTEEQQSQGNGSRTPMQGANAAKKKISLADYKNRTKSNSLGKDSTPLQTTPGLLSTNTGPDGANGNLDGDLSHQTKESTRRLSSSDDRTEEPLNRGQATKGHLKPEDLASSPPAKNPSSPEDSVIRRDQGPSNDKSEPIAEMSFSAILDGRSATPLRSPIRLEGQEASLTSPRAASRSLSPEIEQRRLHPMLSPTLPTVEAYTLPPLLSPNLPPEIEAVLSGLNATRKTKRPNSLTRAEDRASEEGPKAKPSLMVVLKFKKKHHRKELSQYLRLKPSPEKVHWQRKRRDSRGEEHAATQLPRKRDRKDDETEFPKKRSKPSDDEGRGAQTPNLLASSPPMSKSSMLKTHAGTAMPRTGSAQGTTPIPRGRQDTPTRGRRSESPAKQKMRASLSAESARLVNLARDLKHDSDAYLKKENPSEDQLKLGLSIAVESIICFVLAGLVSDEPNLRNNQPGHAKQWKSILQFLSHVKELSHSHRHILGLLYCLEGMIRSNIHDCEAAKVSLYLRETDHANAESSVGPIQKQQAMLKECFENGAKASTAWAQGQGVFWVSELQNSFAKTWARARRAPPKAKVRSEVNVGEYFRERFTLPLGPMSSAIENVNACLSLLSELCGKDKIPWKPKLVL